MARTPAFSICAPILSTTPAASAKSAFLSSSLSLPCRSHLLIHPRSVIPRMSTSSTSTPTSAETPPSSTKLSPADFRFQLPQTFPTPPPLSVLQPSLPLKSITGFRLFLLRLRLFLRLRARLSPRTVLTARLSGALSEAAVTPRLSLSFSPGPLRLPTVITALQAAAHDPRISHLHLRVDALTCGWAKILEIRRHLELFASSGKTITCFLEAGGPKEFFLVAGFATYLPPEGNLSLRGFAAAGSFVRGVLDKIGVDPQVERIGKYKSAGDQLARTSMSDAQRETLTEILNDIEHIWKDGISEATGMDKQSLHDFVNRAPWKMSEYVDAGLITGLCYESQLIDALKLRFAKKGGLFSQPKEEDIIKMPLRAVDISKYARNRKLLRVLGLTGRKKIAIIRAVGAITPGKSGSSPVTGTTVGSDTLIELVRRARDDKRIEGVILRCDSPGGAALASDIVWHELRALSAIKPLIACQGDVAASGGYYLSMGASAIVSEALTLTGSIGVVTAKPSLGQLYKKIGYTKENLSIGGKYAELLVDDRPFSEDEMEYFKDGAKVAYNSFVGKVAQSRGKEIEQIEPYAQGRVWTGKQAKDIGLVDAIGGLDVAMNLLKEKCGIATDEMVTVEEIIPAMSFAQRLGLGGATTGSNGLADGEPSHAANLIEDGKPLLMAEVSGDFGGMSPVAKAVADFIFCKLGGAGITSATGLISGQGSVQLGTIFERIMLTVLSERK